MTVHKHAPVSDGRLRLRWKPIFVEGGTFTIGSGAQMHTETVQVKHVICVAHLNDGVLQHSIARKLDSMNYTFDDKEFQFEQGCLVQPERLLQASGLAPERHVQIR